MKKPLRRKPGAKKRSGSSKRPLPNGSRTAIQEIRDNLPACVATLLDIVKAQDKRIAFLEKRDSRRLIGFTNCESNHEIEDPDEEQIWESGPVG